MRNDTISIALDPQTAQAYRGACPEEKLKIQALLPSLEQVLDEAGRKAQAAGLHLNR